MLISKSIETVSMVQDMSNEPSKPDVLKELTKVSKYGIPIFGVLITGIMGIAKSDAVEVFGFYTLFAAFIAYFHLLAYQRNGGQLSWLRVGLQVFFLHLVAVALLCVMLVSSGDLPLPEMLNNAVSKYL